ncbi:MAG: LysM peptidoglycan-binding domain-containing protein, partial [Microcystis panniformis]
MTDFYITVRSFVGTKGHLIPHTWFVLSRSDQPGNIEVNGFAPSSHGSPFGAGKVFHDDETTHPKEGVFSGTFKITEASYVAIQNYVKTVEANPPQYWLNNGFPILDGPSYPMQCAGFTDYALKLANINLTIPSQSGLPWGVINPYRFALALEVESLKAKTQGNNDFFYDPVKAYYDYYRQPQFNLELRHLGESSESYSVSSADGSRIEAKPTLTGDLIITRLNKSLDPTETLNVYTVRTGDTLSAIEQANGLPSGTLARLNPDINNPNLIFAGEQIYIPAKIGVQKDENGNIVQTKINVDGSGTADVYDEFGNLIDQAKIKISDGIDGTTGTVTLNRDGTEVTLNTEFSFDEETGQSIKITGIESINGQVPNSDSLIDSAVEQLDLNVGDTLLGQNTGTLNQLITAGDPTDTDGWTPPITTGTGNGTDPAWYQTAEAQRLGGALTDIQGLVAALKSGSSLAIATSVFNFAAHISGGGDETFSSISEVVGTATSVIGFRNTILGFNDALKRGDTTAALSSGASIAQVGLKLYQSSLNAQIAAIDALGENLTDEFADNLAELTAESTFVNEALNNLTDTILYLGLINGLAHGDVTSVVASIAAIANIPYVGWIIAAFEIFSSLFDDGPDI